MPRAPELLAVLAATKNARKRTDIGILGNQTKNANDKCARIGIVQLAAVRTAVRRLILRANRGTERLAARFRPSRSLSSHDLVV